MTEKAAVEDDTERRWWTHLVVHDEDRPWRYATRWVHGPNLVASVEWYLLGKVGHGLGFRFGRNGDESDVGLDINTGRLAAVYLRLRSPWTRWARIDREGPDDRDWYKVRHYSLHLFPYDSVWFEAEWDARAGEWSSTEPWWRHVTFGSTQLWGRTTHDTDVVDSGDCEIPMPEGTYAATWTKERHVKRWIRRPGTWRNRWQAPRYGWSIDIPGGIPTEGKGENSWDCGMDGTFGISSGATSLEELIGDCVASVLRDRARYGGPHDLPRPMTVAECTAAEQSLPGDSGT